MRFEVLLCLCIVTVFGRQGFGPAEQEWGFVTVREGAHIFWWLYKTTAKVDSYIERPLIIWLQGGPGASSTGFGNFAELGPLDTNLKPRNTTWVKKYNVLFVDNPVGTGYSYVDSPSYLTTTNRQIADDFVALLKEFYQNNLEFKETPLYIFSESYGGKMAAEIALVVDKAIKSGELEINLAGVGLGDAWISPIDCVNTWASYLLSLGAVDQNGYEQIQLLANRTKAAVDSGNYNLATQLWSDTETIIEKVTNDIDFYNILTKIPITWKHKSNRKSKIFHLRNEEDDKIDKIMNDKVSRDLGLNVTWGRQSGAVFQALWGDFMKPVTNIVELLLNTTDIKVAVFNGQLDLIVDTPGTVEWVDKLKFEGSENWKTTTRYPIVVDEYIEGYFKQIGNFAMYWVNRAGHMVPLDNPAAMDFILQEMTGGYERKNINFIDKNLNNLS